MTPGRKMVLRRSFIGAGVLIAGPLLARCSSEPNAPSDNEAGGAGGGGAGAGDAGGAGAAGGMGGGPPTMSNLGNLGPLGEPDENGIRLPAGFTARVVARSSNPVENTVYVWKSAPDGGATFPTSDGGWIYVSNSEVANGGANAIRFDADGTIVDAYSILDGTNRNCAGGPTPWGTWMSCEEVDVGLVWECDPTGQAAAVSLPALGVFNHEAVTVDPKTSFLFLTEDQPDGRLYRFRPSRVSGAAPDLSAGVLEVAQVRGATGPVAWLEVPDPSASATPTREQVPESTAFKGGEGIWHQDGIIYFSTKGDNRVWSYDLSTNEIAIIYDDDTSDNPILTGVDNVTVSPFGDVLVAEDGGDLQIVILLADGRVVPLLQAVGHDKSEITGPAFDPALKRLYFSSQRGTTGLSSAGMTFEVTGPFFI